MKIVVVDDEPDIKSLFEQEFEEEIKSHHLDFNFKQSSEDTLAYLNQQTQPVDLILADINMPGLNGLELLKTVKQKYRPTKVVMVTAYGNDEFFQKSLRFGADGFVRKPIDFEELKGIIIDLMERSNSKG
jgi:two-component system, chemotaxis family, chemotaxis protein CheY